MAKIVIAGVADCPHYAACELLGDKLHRILENFSLTKIVVPPSEWDEFSNNLSKERGWPKMISPIIWRELVDTGGRASLIGDAKNFMEYAYNYYGQVSEFSSYRRLQIASENRRCMEDIMAAKAIDQLMRNTWSKITIVGAESPIATRLSFLLATMNQAELKNSQKKMKLHLFPSDSSNYEAIEKLKDGINDAACSSLQAIETSLDLKEALSDASLVVIMDVVPIMPPVLFEGVLKFPESRSQWLDRRFHYFYRLGESIKQLAQQNVRVLVVGCDQFFESAPGVTMKVFSPLNFDVQTLHMACKDIIALNNIVGLPRAIDYSLKEVLARQLGVHRCDMTDFFVWGNIGTSIIPDASQTRVHRRHGALDGEVGPSWFSLEATPILQPLEGEREEILAEKLRQATAPTTSAAAVFSYINQWQLGYRNGKGGLSSLVVSSGGHYNVPPGVAFCFPVNTSPMGGLEICQDIFVGDNLSNCIMQCTFEALKDWSVVDPSVLSQYRESCRTRLDELRQAGEAPLAIQAAADIIAASENPVDEAPMEMRTLFPKTDKIPPPGPLENEPAV